MNATNHMNALMTGNSPATYLLALLGGQTAGLAGAHGMNGKDAVDGEAGIDFEALLQSLASDTGIPSGTSMTENAIQGDGQPVAMPDLATLLSIYREAQAPAASDAADGDPLQALANMLQEAGVDLGTLALPEGLDTETGSGTGDGPANALPFAVPAEDGETPAEGTADPLLALISLLTGQTPGGTGAGTDGPGDTGAAAGEPAPAPAQAHATSSTRPAQADSARTDESMKALLASLTPEDRARITDALRQLQAAATSPQPTAMPAQAAGQTGELETSSPALTQAAATPQAAKPEAQAGQPGQKQVQAEAPPQTQAQTQASAPTHAQAQAQAGMPRYNQDQTQVHQQPQAAQAVPRTPQTDAASRALSEQMPEHLAREITVHVSQDRRSGRGTGGQPLLAAGTAAGVMAMGQQTGVTSEQTGALLPQAQGQGQAPAQAAPQAQAAASQAATSVDGFISLISSMDESAATDSLGLDALTDGAEGIGRAGGLEQLDSSVVKLSRAPMTHQAAPSQVALHLSKAAEHGSSRFVIQLNPASLGEVDVEMNVAKDGSVHAMLRVEKPETLHMLQRDQGLLQQALENAGLKPDGGSLSFSLKQDGSRFADQGGGTRPGGAAAAAGEGETALADTAAQPVRSRHAGQLDVTI